MSLCQGTLCPAALRDRRSSDVFFHVVTPERIPQFIIPSLDIHQKRRCSGKGVARLEGVAQLEGTARRSSWEPAVEDEPGSNPSRFNSSRSAPDPTAWAALSLPHLPKVTTPYGFVTLGRSPQVTSEEAFFHSGRSWQEEPGCCGHPGVPEGRSATGGHRRDGKQQPGPRGSGDTGDTGDGSSATPAGLPPPRCARDTPKTAALGSRGAERRDRRLLGAGCPRSSSSPELPAATAGKKLFQRILRRHLAHPRGVSLCTDPAEQL